MAVIRAVDITKTRKLIFREFAWRASVVPRTSPFVGEYCCLVTGGLHSFTNGNAPSRSEVPLDRGSLGLALTELSLLLGSSAPSAGRQIRAERRPFRPL